MKRLQQIVLGVASFAFAVSASAVTVTHYEGAGVWKDSKGGAGNYTVVSTMEHDVNTLKIHDVVTIDGKVENINSTLQKIDDTFYDVVDESNQPIGSGYCFPIEGSTGGKLCHTEVDLADGFVESTVHLVGDTLSRMGSKVNQDGEKIIWKDTLKLK
jgi:hypothetical protein